MISCNSPSLSAFIRSSHLRPHIKLTTFQPAAENSFANSVMIFELPLTGPSSLCRLQLITKIRLLRFSLPAKLIAPLDSGSSISPSPQKTHTFLDDLLSKPLFSKYFMICAW